MDLVNQSNYWKMEVLMSMSILLLMKMTRPLWVSLMILVISILMTGILYKMTISSIMSLIIILVFASGMMILFIYASSLTPNQTNKMKKTKMMSMLLIPMLISSQMTQKLKINTIKSFSSKLLLLMMVLILLVSLHAISNQSFNPIQSMSSTF